MKTVCPSCAKNLSVSDEFAGRRVRCPGCQQVFQIPSSSPRPAAAALTPASTDVSERPLAARKPVAAAVAAVRKGAPPPPLPTRSSCPECGAPLTENAAECRECDWTAEVKPSKKPSRRAAPLEDGLGACYIQIRKDEVGLNQEIERLLVKYIETEQLDLRIRDDEAPDDLGANDLIISGRVEVADYGSQFIRYFLTFISMFGPGSCTLDVDAEIETGEGDNKRIRSRARQWIGVFGGLGSSLMKRNVQIVGGRIAKGAAQRISGRSYLNAQAYNCANWSLALGLMALLPFVGPFFGMISIVLGLIALVVVSKRGLPRGKLRAIAGPLLSFVGFAVTVGFVFFVLKK